LFELETQFSSDGILFGIRESRRTQGLTFAQEQARVSHTLMPFQEIAALMTAYDDWHLIINPQYRDNLYAFVNTIEHIVNIINRINPSLIDRIVLQVPNQHAYHYLAGSSPFSAYIYNLHSSPDTDTQALEFLERTGIPAVRMPVDRATPEFLEALDELGVSVFITVPNDLIQTHEFLRAGIAGIFTDTFTPAMLQMSEAQLQNIVDEQLALQKQTEFISFVSRLPAEPDNNHIRFIRAESVNMANMSESMLDAFHTLTNLSSVPIGEFMKGSNLVIDGFHYTNRINSSDITYIIYDNNSSRLLQWVTFDPLADYARIDFDVTRENNRKYLLGYLSNLLCDNSIVLISVRSEASHDLDASILEKLSALGITHNLQENDAYSYAAIIDGRTVIYEMLSIDMILHALVIDRWLIELQSGGRLSDNPISQIIIDGVDHSINHRGINIVVLNKLTGLIEDSVAFDTHSGLAAHRD
jgi:hypothetical protein